mmetsp:Transcript_7563/g.11006  ORF Transcript_7563/g.11006 Transcript_7563/m.11006 type:complete len:612 (+) Transcript_7563:173-2008(+)|eukprot:CAMPEP_0194228766 /NCGR_PEP_ID=MMETSP0156-20130528/43540_1 /TAXON_ID=33649 /ORGANISM="Thalassionema nitzschioides, Strain L26-B" /LENGTH=611 /DNA_ID=CAMNT_0038961287 /DNA_START=145 /DNA_END=1980 /DNA_ORIENTATION=+
MSKTDETSEMKVSRSSLDLKQEELTRSSVRNLFSLNQQESGRALAWQNVTLNLVQKGEIKKEILKGVGGEALPFETTAIMGASGSGKTSLFNAISGRIGSGPLALEGDIRFGDHPLNASTRKAIQDHIAYVAQFDTLHEPSTPREAIFFSARLRLPKETSDEKIHSIVDNALHALMLDKCADTIIGGGLIKGISGGQKKRTSIGVEMVTNPSVIMLDEPTSGLDSFASEQLMGLLKKVAEAGSTVLFTIHQPSSDTFGAFDKVILLNEGRVMYSGETKHVVSDFAKFGHAIKEHTNPAEWMLSTAQRHSEESLEKEGFFPSDDRTFSEPTGELPEASTYAPFGRQITNLLRREYIAKKRIPALLIMNVCIALVIGFLSGFLFRGIGEDDRSDPSGAVLQAMVGVFVNCLLNSMMGQSSAALMVLSQERPLFLREYTTKTYSTSAFVLVKLLVELFDTFLSLIIQTLMIYYLVELRMNYFIFFGLAVLTSLSATSMASFLGSTVSDPQMAQALFPMVILPQFYFSGVLVPLSYIPAWLRWMHYVCSLWYALALCLTYEFKECDAEEEPYCEGLLERQEISTSKEGLYWIIFIVIMAVFKILSTLLMRAKAQY